MCDSGHGVPCIRQSYKGEDTVTRQKKPIGKERRQQT